MTVHCTAKYLRHMCETLSTRGTSRISDGVCLKLGLELDRLNSRGMHPVMQPVKGDAPSALLTSTPSSSPCNYNLIPTA